MQLAIDVEVSSMGEFSEAVALKPGRIILDNVRAEGMRQGVALAGGKVELGASCNATLENMREIRRAGVDFMSVGALTHSVRVLDISLEIT